MKITEIKAKTILSKSQLSDFVLNPYVGCQHGCKYCYAKFMRRFSGHEGEVWGDFVDVKANAVDLIADNYKKYHGKSMTFSSVTDPYQPLEIKYQLTRKLLQKVLVFQPDLCIITKSSLVMRDIDLLKQFTDCSVFISLGFLDDELRRKIEPYASSVNARIYALKKLHENGIKTGLFVAPIFPYLSDWENIIKKTMPFADEYFFENLHIYGASKHDIYKSLFFIDRNLMKRYRDIYNQPGKYWNAERQKISDFCEYHALTYKICFHSYEN
jgi:DNA repair photolyase